MSSLRDEAISIIENSEDTADAAETLLNGPRAIGLYVLSIGVEAIKSKVRRSARQSLKREIQPIYIKGPVTGSLRLSKRSIQRMAELGDRLWAEWKVGIYSLGEMSKEQLLAQIENERKSAHGSLQNVQFYRAIAAPLKDGQRVKEYWSPESIKDLKRKVWTSTKDKRPSFR